MFLSSLIEELCTKEENNEAGRTLTFRGQCIFELLFSNLNQNLFRIIKISRSFLEFQRFIGILSQILLIKMHFFLIYSNSI